MNNFTNKQSIAIAILRILIGWHLLYEGLVKFMNPDWSSYGFLNSSKWIFSDLFKAIASNDTLLKITDTINVWGLLLIGLFLMLGIFKKTVSYLGAALLFLYYIAIPPLVGIEYSMPMEGSYMIVNKTLIEAAALIVIGLFSNNKILGLKALSEKVQRKFKKTDS